MYLIIASAGFTWSFGTSGQLQRCHSTGVLNGMYHSGKTFVNSLPNEQKKIFLGWSHLKTCADDKVDVTKKLTSVFTVFWYYQHFLLFSKIF